MILFVDCSNLCHAAAHTTGDLELEGKKVGVIFGFLQKFLSILRERPQPPSAIVFTWDTRRHENYRRRIYPKYKAQRQAEPGKEIDYDQFTQLRTEVLPNMGFANQWHQKGYEADDLMAQGVLCYPQEHHTIISTDTDLYQLLRPSVDIIKPKTRLKFTLKDFEELFGTTDMSLFIQAKSLAGDNSDNITGIDGIGVPTAMKFLTGKLFKGKKYDALVDPQYTHQTSLNSRLICLPYKQAEDPIKIPHIQGDPIDWPTISAVLKSFKFERILMQNRGHYAGKTVDEKMRRVGIARKGFFND